MYLKPKQFCDERLHFRLERNYIRTFYKFYFEVAIWVIYGFGEANMPSPFSFVFGWCNLINMSIHIMKYMLLLHLPDVSK